MEPPPSRGFFLYVIRSGAERASERAGGGAGRERGGAGGSVSQHFHFSPLRPWPSFVRFAFLRHHITQCRPTNTGCYFRTHKKRAAAAATAKRKGDAGRAGARTTTASNAIIDQQARFVVIIGSSGEKKTVKCCKLKKKHDEEEAAAEGEEAREEDDKKTTRRKGKEFAGRSPCFGGVVVVLELGRLTAIQLIDPNAFNLLEARSMHQLQPNACGPSQQPAC